jgi:phospholipid/cholesterol/gamma-HCH transport system substrate-binding protein
MKHDHINYAVVGTFVLAMLVILLVALSIITGRSFGNVEYFTRYDNVAGLEYGTLVSFEGYQIGQVETIEPDPSKDAEKRYIVRFSADKRWTIPKDSVARIVSSGLLSGLTIDIKEGQSKEYLEPGQELPGLAGTDLFAAISNAASEVGSLTSEGLRPLIDNVSKSLSTIAAQAESSVPKILADLEALSAKLNKSADTVTELLNEGNRDRITSFLENLDGSLKKLNQVLDESSTFISKNRPDMEQAIDDLRSSLEVVSQHIESITFNMEGTSLNMKEFSRQIRENPGLLLGGTPQKDKVQESK